MVVVVAVAEALEEARKQVALVDRVASAVLRVGVAAVAVQMEAHPPSRRAATVEEEEHASVVAACSSARVAAAVALAAALAVARAPLRRRPPLVVQEEVVVLLDAAEWMAVQRGVARVQVLGMRAVGSPLPWH